MKLLEQPIRGLTQDLLRTIGKLEDRPTPKAIHRFRTTIRRMQSLLSYANPDLSKKLQRSLETLEDLRKRAGKIRNVDVQRKLLERIGNGSTARDRKSLLEILDKKREKHLARLNSAIARRADDKFLARIDRIPEKVAVEPSDFERLPPLQEAHAQLERMASQFSSQSIKSNRLHDARIQLKKIRYLAELAEESPEGRVFVEQIKGVQDTLGEWHDWEELNGLAEKQFAERANCALLREVRALFVARQAAAISALSQLLSSVSAPAPKKPASATQLPRMAARHAG